MGLLDDAIREHLELKRRHGADPEEVQRQEREALGASPQRAEFAQPEGEEPAAVAAGSADEPEVADDTPHPPGQEPPPEPPVPDADEEDPWDVEELADEPQAPREDDQPGAVAAGAPPEGVVRPDDEEPADELEETPEFLQETPEHDRLWFEQKPPRDFDWDK